MTRRGIKRMFRFPFRRREDIRSDIREEFEFHVDMRTEELMRFGMNAVDARAQARREFGDARAGEEGCVGHGERLVRRHRIGQPLDPAQERTVVCRQRRLEMCRPH